MSRYSNSNLRALVLLAFLTVSVSLYCWSPSRSAHVAAQSSTPPTTTANVNPPQSVATTTATPPPPVALTPEERRGKQLYLQGTSVSGKEIQAYLGESSLEVPGSAMACANCHGLDGQGRPEGGVAPSNLTWEALTKPYGVTHASGRTHPPYTDRAVELALTRGLDPAGNHLLNVMPRYQMSREDMTDLIAYLKRLGTDRDPGLGEGSIKIGLLSPKQGALAEMGRAIQAVVAAYFAEVNSQGGIYNRKLELKVAETGATAAETTTGFTRLVKDEGVFAVTSAMIAGADREVATLAQTSEVPLVGPFTLYPPASVPVNRQVFYLLSGVEDQSRALVNFAAQKFPGKSAQRAAVVYPVSEVNAGVADAIIAQGQKAGWSAPLKTTYARGQFDAATLAAGLSAKGVNSLFFLGTGDDLGALLAVADKLKWTPAIYLPGATTGADILAAPASFKEKIYLSFPTVPADFTPAGQHGFRALAVKYQLPADHVAAQIAAYVSAQLLVEGLKRAGRDLSREKLIVALEGLYEYETGLTHALTYGPNRRTGAAGAYIVSVDVEKREFIPVGGWVGVAP